MYPLSAWCHAIQSKASPLRFDFAWSHAIRSKGRKSQSPTLAPLQPPHAFCRDRTIAHFFEMSAIVCAYKVFGFAECFWHYWYHALFAEACGRSSSCAPGRRESNADTTSISVGQRDPTPGFCRANSSHRLFAGCCGRPSGVALSATFEVFCFNSSFREVLCALLCFLKSFVL